ncbi:glycine N-phenylacetyltransferase isoform X2 [Amia ocellicauda]|uniref:glycine N-phenylacetyltransferase isoform X2 n=1 Tax=Amia ocellicauda TaxID=2972642 RepID=UPI0034643A61
MHILQSAKNLVALKSMLHRELPQSMSVYGGLLHIMNNNRCHLEMCVDSWPDFSTVICRRQKQDVASMRTMLMDDRVISWKKEIIMSAIPSYCSGVIQEIASSNGMEVEKNVPLNLCIQNNPKYMEYGGSELASKISSLNVSHAELVCSHLAFGGNKLTLNHVRSCIQNLPSCCILDEGGNPVSWSLMDELYSVRMGFTLPEYRKLGYIKTITAVLVNKARSLGLPVYCHVHRMNKEMLHFLNSQDCTVYPEMYMLLFVTSRHQQGEPE